METQSHTSLPVVVGVTGHRNLRKEDLPLLRERITLFFTKLREACPHSPLCLLSSLAQGADQLCAEVALEMGVTLIAPLPMEQALYEKDFSGQNLDAFRTLLAASSQVFVAPETEECDDGQRDYAYRRAGIYIARHSHLLLALWDGSSNPDNSRWPCGTGAVVNFTLHSAYRDPWTKLRAPDECGVVTLTTPRESEPLPANAFALTLLEETPGATADRLTKLDRFNRDAQSIPAALGEDPITQTYHAADTLAITWQKRYLSTLKILAGLGMLLVLSYLLYDELAANLFLLVYAGSCLAMFLLYRRAKRLEIHRKYLEYRLLAEQLRVQRNLTDCGLADEAADLLPFAQKVRAAWCRSALRTLCIGGPVCPPAPLDVKTRWIQDQRDYHRRACGKTARLSLVQERVSNTMLALTVLMMLLFLVLEFLDAAVLTVSIPVPAWLGAAVLIRPGSDFSVWSLLSILLGSIPAVTLFLSSYYGKLSLDRRNADHSRMAILYDEALTVLSDCRGDARAEQEILYRELAREELIEAGDWLSYSMDNKPDILL